MVARKLAFASVAVDENSMGSGPHRSRTENEIDSHALAFVEVAISIVPPGVEAFGIVMFAKGVGHSPCFQSSQTFPFRRRGVCHADKARRVIHVAIIWGDIEIAYDGNVLGGVCVGFKVALQPVEPLQLVGVVVVVEASSVGHVTRCNTDPATCCPQDACVGVGFASIGKVGTNVIEADPRQNRNPVPLPLAVMSALVTHVVKRLVRKVVVSKFGFLQTQDVGLKRRYPLLNPVHPSVQGVDVPRDESHGAEI